MNPSTEDSSLDGNRTANIKITRDPVTLYPMVEFQGKKIVLKKDTTARDLQEKGLAEIKEAQLA